MQLTITALSSFVLAGPWDARGFNCDAVQLKLRDLTFFLPRNFNAITLYEWQFVWAADMMNTKQANEINSVFFALANKH